MSRMDSFLQRPPLGEWREPCESKYSEEGTDGCRMVRHCKDCPWDTYETSEEGVKELE